MSLLSQSTRLHIVHRVHILIEMKQGQCICPLSWSVHCNFTGEGKCNERGWACTPHPTKYVHIKSTTVYAPRRNWDCGTLYMYVLCAPPSPARTDFTLITECTPSSGCNSVYSVILSTCCCVQARFFSMETKILFFLLWCIQRYLIMYIKL
jgi:hypothetical protein